jgi:hypothetical protein
MASPMVLLAKHCDWAGSEGAKLTLPTEYTLADSKQPEIDALAPV